MPVCGGHFDLKLTVDHAPIIVHFSIVILHEKIFPKAKLPGYVAPQPEGARGTKNGAQRGSKISVSGSGRFLDQEQWERWRVERKLVFGSMHRGRCCGSTGLLPRKKFQILCCSYCLNHDT